MIYESSININGTEYPIVCNGYAVREIQNKFGKMSNLGSVLTTDGEPNFSAILDLATILLEAGQRYSKVVGKECPPPMKSWEDVIDITDMSILETLLTTISKGMTREVETVSKNGEAKQEN